MTSSGLFDVYGLPRVGTQQGGAVTSSQGYVGSLGHVTDQSTGGLIYMQARYYDPSLGRFVSEDPKQNGNNWYAYCNNDPVNFIDSNGKVSTTIGKILTVVGWALTVLGVIIAFLAAGPLAADLFALAVGSLADGVVLDAVTTVLGFLQANTAVAYLGGALTIVAATMAMIVYFCDAAADPDATAPSGGSAPDIQPSGPTGLDWA